MVRKSKYSPISLVTLHMSRLLKAEQAVLAAGGNVLRLVGLYHAQRGAHTFFLRKGVVPRWAGYTVNLIHYEDAALLALAVSAACRTLNLQGTWKG